MSSTTFDITGSRTIDMTGITALGLQFTTFASPITLDLTNLTPGIVTIISLWNQSGADIVLHLTASDTLGNPFHVLVNRLGNVIDVTKNGVTLATGAIQSAVGSLVTGGPATPFCLFGLI